MSFLEKVKETTGGLCDTCQSSKPNSSNRLATSFKKRGFKFSCLKHKSISFTEEKPNSCDAYLLKYSMKLNIATKKISHQFPNTPEGKLMFDIISVAINDLGHGAHRESAENFLKNEIPQAEICGVGSNWIKKVLLECEVFQ